jgi:putative addiction module component (TIGR02574 family)
VKVQFSAAADFEKYWAKQKCCFFCSFVLNQPNMADLILEITKLSIADRIKLVQEILSTIAKDADSQDFVLTNAQQTEIERRSASLTNCKAKTISWDKIETALTERYGVSQQ